MMEVSMLLVKHYGVLSKNKRSWSKELNLVSWNGREPKYDLREWAEDRKKSSKGLTFTVEEILNLKAILNEIYFEEHSPENFSAGDDGEIGEAGEGSEVCEVCEGGSDGEEQQEAFDGEE